MTLPQTIESNSVTALPPPNYTAHQLVEGMRARDKKMCTAFFDCYATHVNRLVKRFLGPGQDHADIVNSVFLEIFASIRKIRDPQTLSKWVSTVTVQTVYREIRRRKYQRALLFLSDEPEKYINHSNQTHKLSHQLFRVLRSFPPDEHVHFVLYYLEGNTFEEIAAFTKCSLSTAKRRGKRCRQRFLQATKNDNALAHVIEDWKNA